MRNAIIYSVVIYFFSMLQTVLLPEVFSVIGSTFSVITVDFFLLLAIYFSFNRDFFHGFLWIIILFFIESGLGYVWPGVQIPILLLLFFAIQGLKVQFVFQNYYAIRVVVFTLCMIEHFLHIRLGTSFGWGSVLMQSFLPVMMMAFLHALIAPVLFEALTNFDAKTIYRFETQRTLFTSQIRSI